MILTNNKKDALRKSNTSGANYLFLDNEYSKYDISDKTLSCGRRGDALKLWVALKFYGLKGFAKIADDAIEKTKYLIKRVEEQPEKF